MGYDPAFLNTANTKSAITFIDGDRGILEYRGYPIEQLAEKSSYLEVAYLLMNGELPTASQLEEFAYLVTHHTFVHENVKRFMQGFRYDAHPMSMVASTVAAAMEAAKAGPVDFLISDLGLPDGSGYDLLKALNQIRPTRAIAVSGYASPEDIQKSREAGFLQHLSKPIDFDTLDETIERLGGE